MPVGFKNGTDGGVFFFQAEDGIRDLTVTGVQTCALPISTEKGEVTQMLATTPEHYLLSASVQRIAGPADSATVELNVRLELLDHASRFNTRSEEHTSELQSQSNLVCRLLLEKNNIETRTVCRLTD